MLLHEYGLKVISNSFKANPEDRMNATAKAKAKAKAKQRHCHMTNITHQNIEGYEGCCPPLPQALGAADKRQCKCDDVSSDENGQSCDCPSGEALWGQRVSIRMHHGRRLGLDVDSPTQLERVEGDFEDTTGPNKHHFPLHCAQMPRRLCFVGLESQEEQLGHEIAHA